MSVQRRVSTASWPVFLVAYSVLCTSLVSLLRWRWGWPWWSLWLGPAMGVLGTVLFVLRRVRLQAQGRWEPTLAAADAFLSARVPADAASRAELMRMLALQRMTSSGLGRWLWMWLATLALIQVPAALDRPRVWPMAAIMGAMAGFYAWRTPRNRRRVAAIDRQLNLGA